MNKKEYKKLVDDVTPKPKKTEHSIIAFLSGGILASICEIIRSVMVNYYKMPINDAVSIILLSLIFLACFLTSLFDFDKWVIKLKAGLIVPITGFAHSIQSSALDYKKDGLITGLGANFFKLAGSVILYGIVSAFVFTVLKVIFNG